MPVHSSNCHCHLITHHLCAEHCYGLALGGVDLARHDTWSWLIFRENQLSKTTSGSTSQKSDVVCYFHNTDCCSIQGSMEINKGIFSSKWFKFIGSSNKFIPSLFWHLFCNCLSKTNIGVKAGSNCSSSLGQLWNLRNRCFNSSNGHFNLMSISRKLLSKGHGSSILGVCSSYFYYVSKILWFFLELGMESF